MPALLDPPSGPHSPQRNPSEFTENSRTGTLATRDDRDLTAKGFEVVRPHGLAAAGLVAALEPDGPSGLGVEAVIEAAGEARYAALLVEALEPGRVPQPLAAVLARV